MPQEKTMQRTRRVAVVGAGAAGICAAKYLLQAGLDVELFEIGSKIGGLWVYENDNGRSSAYKTLHINSEKRNTQFSDFPFPAEIQYFPDHHDMATYLRSYADNFGVSTRIRFGQEVTAIVPLTDNEGQTRWQIETKAGQREIFETVIVASGHLTIPSPPEWSCEFSGQFLHSHYYREPAPFAGKKVLVVGTGNSGCDIVADLCTHAERTVLSARSPELIVPKIFLGVPVTQITGFFERKWLPEKVPQIARRIITRLVHGRMEDWGLQTPKGLTHPTSHATLINHIAYRKVHVRPGIESVEGSTVKFTDGSSEKFDTVIAATGYKIDYPFVSKELLPLENERADLYKRIVPVEWPGLYYVGLFNTLGSSNLRMFEVQSRWIASIETGEGLLPAAPDMWADIHARNDDIAKRFPPGPRHAIEIQPSRYTREMARETALGIKRRRSIERAYGSVPKHLCDQRAVARRSPVEVKESVKVPQPARLAVGNV